MGTYFLDTSALTKRYVSEQGSQWIISLCQRDAENTLIISQATLAEAVASFCRKAREQNLHQRISEIERDQNIKKFRGDARRQYNVVRVTSAVYTHAGDLCRTHKLRAYDAIQLASVLKIQTALAALRVTPIFLSADIELLSVAQAIGLNIGNPNDYS